MRLTEGLLDRILALSYEAGKYLIQFYNGTITVQTKLDNTPVTEADLWVSQFLTQELFKLFPHIPVLSEENCNIPLKQRQCWETYWLIDPLDGTQQFIDHTDQFSVLITLIHKNNSILSVIYAPILDLTYYAMKGCGAYKKTKNNIQQLYPCPSSLSEPLRIVIGSTTSKEKVRSILADSIDCDFIVLGSSSLKSGLVAEGKADCYVRLGKTGEWDTAAAEILLAEMGGGIFDLNFRSLTYNQRETLINPDFVMVGNKKIDWESVFRFD